MGADQIIKFLRQFLKFKKVKQFTIYYRMRRNGNGVEEMNSFILQIVEESSMFAFHEGHRVMEAI